MRTFLLLLCLVAGLAQAQQPKMDTSQCATRKDIKRYCSWLREQDIVTPAQTVAPIAKPPYSSPGADAVPQSKSKPLTVAEKAEDAEYKRIGELFGSLLQRTDLTAAEILSLGDMQMTYWLNSPSKYAKRLEEIQKAADERAHDRCVDAPNYGTWRVPTATNGENRPQCIPQDISIGTVAAEVEALKTRIEQLESDLDTTQRERYDLAIRVSNLEREKQ